MIEYFANTINNKKNILISGVGSGLGKFLFNNLNKNIERFNLYSFNRNINNKDNKVQLENSNHIKPDIIIHCAFDNSLQLKHKDIYDYYYNNILVLENLLSLINNENQKFIFISSIEVYNFIDDKYLTQCKAYTEDINLNIDQKNIKPIKLYALFKLMAEEIIKKKLNNYLILRPSAMLGLHARPNSLYKILFENNQRLSLHSNSTFNYISHDMIGKFINYCILKNITGIYNLVSDNNVSLKEIVSKYDKNPCFGEFEYITPIISNEKIKIEQGYKILDSFEAIDYYYKLVCENIKQAEQL